MKNYAKAIMLATSIGFLSAPISYAQTDTIDTEIGLQNVEKVDAEFLKSCVKTESLDNGGKRAKEVLRSVHCDNGDQNTSYYYYQLYPDVPTFLGKEKEKPLQGYFNIGDDAKVIDGKLDSIYQSSLSDIQSYNEKNIINDKNIMYYKFFVNDDNMRVEENEATHAAYVPVYKRQKQYIPPIGGYIDPAVTRDAIEDNDVPSNVNIDYVQKHSQIAPEEGIEAALNKQSVHKENTQEGQKTDVQTQQVESTVAVTVTETHKAPTPKEKPREPKEPLTLADFKWLIIGLGVLAGIILVSVIIEIIRRGNKRRREEREQRRIAEQERQHKENMWNDAISTIDKTMADYAQRDADIANKTLFYPLIDDITHPLHIEFLDKMSKVESIKEMSFNESQIDYVSGFAQDFSRTWNNLFSTAQEVGVPWIKKKEDQERAQKLLSLVLDDNAYEGEREIARENLIKLVNDLFEQDKEERTTMSFWKNTVQYNEDPIYDKHHVQPNNLKNSINKNLNKPVRELAKQQALAIESKR